MRVRYHLDSIFPFYDTHHIIMALQTASQVRLAARNNSLTGCTSGLAPGSLQANLIVLPSRYAADFRILCARNPVPCPLLAESADTGAFDSLKSHLPGLDGKLLTSDQIASHIDIRHDAPRYNVYENGILTKALSADIAGEWDTNDHVAFFIGCSYSFEAALTQAGLPPRHTVLGRNVPMYRTKIPLCPAGIFTGSTYVVSMRPYKRSDVETVRDITRRYGTTHGEPIAWGWDALEQLGIENIGKPQWGDKPLHMDGTVFDNKDADVVPVFWGCGVTPHEAVMRAELKGTVMGHAPGYMIVLDVKEDDVFART